MSDPTTDQDRNEQLIRRLCANAQAVVWPTDLASGALIYPYAKAKRRA
jgi:hypothetical protein